jgi:hypothetical protein
MKQQTFLSCYYADADKRPFEYEDFDRWSFKRPETVLRKILEFMQDPSAEVFTKRWNVVKVFATPDGYNYDETQPVLTWKREAT